MAISQKKLAYPYEYFNNTDDYKKPGDNLQKEDFFRKLKNKCPEDDGITRTKEIIKVFNIKNGGELTKLYFKSVVILLADVFEKFVKVPAEEYGMKPLYCISLPGSTYQCALKYTDIKVKTLQDEDLILLLENNIRGGLSGVMGNRYVKSDQNKKMIYMDATNIKGHDVTIVTIWWN